MYASVISGPNSTFLHLRFLLGDGSVGASFGDSIVIATATEGRGITVRQGVLNVDIGGGIAIDDVSE